MTTGAAVMANPLFAFVLQLGIVHEGGVRVRRRILFFLSLQESGDVLCVFHTEAEAGHHRHILHLELVAVVRTLTVFEVKNVWQALLGVILRANVFLLVRAVRTRALARIVNPAYQVIVVGLLTDAREVRCERAALHLIAFANRMAR